MADGLLDSLDVRRSPIGQDASERTPHAINKELRSARAASRSDRPHGPDISQIVAQALALLRLEPMAQLDGHDQTPLSPREGEVAALIARGLTNRQIAAELSIAERTADTHVSHLLGKLGAKTRSQIAAWVVEHDLRTTESS
jgi:DNA-binding NarL/FixJ family response regulator